MTVDDLRRFERRHGRIPDGALVCMNSGWAAKLDDPLVFKGGPSFPDYVNFLATDRYGLENLNNLDKIPPRGALAYVGLIPWQEGSGGPSRVIANW